MHSRIAELVAYLDRQGENLRQAFESVPADHRMQRAAPGRWSAAEVVHHVVIVERAVVRQVIAAGDGLALGAVSAPHMRLGDLTAYEWIAFAGAHAARHADQIREMTVSLA